MPWREGVARRLWRIIAVGWLAILGEVMPAVAQTADEQYAHGCSFYAEGRFTKAAETLRKALGHDPEHAQAKALLQIVEEDVGKGGNDSAPTRASQRNEALKDQDQVNHRLRRIIDSAVVRIQELAEQHRTDQRASGDLNRRLTETQQQLTGVQGQLGSATTQLEAAEELLETDRRESQALLQKVQKTETELSASLRQVQQAHDRIQEQMSVLRQEREQVRQEFAEQQDGLKRTAAELGQRQFEADALRAQLERVQQELVSVAAQRDELARAKDDLAAQLAELQRERTRQAQTLEAQRQELSNVQVRLDSAEERTAALDGNVGELVKTNTSLAERLKLREGELDGSRGQVVELKAARESLAQRVTELERVLQAKEKELSDAGRSLAGMRQEREQLLEQLRIAQETHRRLTSDLHALQEIKGVHDALKEEMARRDVQLKQAESVIHLMQVPSAFLPSATPMAGGALESGLLQGSPVKICQVDKEFDFVVISVDELGGVGEGTALVLANPVNPVATVELTELDEAGFAVAQITHRVDPQYVFSKGDVLFARQLIKPVAQ